MKLEIDIPSIIYNDAKENRGYISVGKMEIVWKAVADGKPLEQEPILDNIRAEITAIAVNGQVDEHTMFIRTGEQIKQMALNIIDKYKGEPEC